jgi:hypothetical protein
MNFLSTEPQHATCLPSGILPGFGASPVHHKCPNGCSSREKNFAGKSGFVGIDIIDIT